MVLNIDIFQGIVNLCNVTNTSSDDCSFFLELFIFMNSLYRHPREEPYFRILLLWTEHIVWQHGVGFVELDLDSHRFRWQCTWELCFPDNYSIMLRVCGWVERRLSNDWLWWPRQREGEAQFMYNVTHYKAHIQWHSKTIEVHWFQFQTYQNLHLVTCRSEYQYEYLYHFKEFKEPV